MKGLGMFRPAMAMFFLGVWLVTYGLVVDRASAFEVCRADDRSCQTRGSIGLACVGGNNREVRAESGLSMRVDGGRWIVATYGGGTAECRDVLTVRAQTGRGRSAGQVRTCSANDRGCQRPGDVGLACLQTPGALVDPREWQHNGHAMRVANGQWTMIHGNDVLPCLDVVVGRVGASARRVEGGLFLCDGRDPQCVSPDLVPVACDMEATGFRDLSDWQFSGFSIVWEAGHWRMLYAGGDVFDCRGVIFAQAGAARRPPPPTPRRDYLPAGSVLLFDRRECPIGWSEIGVARGGSRVIDGMVYCRFD